MKHLIIVNGKAGSLNGDISFSQKIKENFEGLDYEIHFTTASKEATSFLRDYFNSHKEKTRVYACGGDGTISEVVNGIVGVPNAELAIIPVGTGNDFVKIYGGVKRFLDFKKMISAETTLIDLSKISGETLKEPLYSINVINFGFDAIVGAKGNENKLKGIKNPYGPKAIIPAILHGRFNKTVVIADGEPLNKEKLLLASLSQGQFVGGEYHASPKSDNTDGLIDVVVMKTMSFLTLMTKYFKAYHDGKHLDNPKLMKKLYYRRAKHIEIVAPKDIDICVDGEIIRGSHFDVEVMPKAINLVLPKE